MKHHSLSKQIGKNITCPLFSQLFLFLFVLFSVGQASAQAITSYSFAIRAVGTCRQVWVRH